ADSTLSNSRYHYMVDATSPNSGSFVITLFPENIQLSGDANFCIPSWAPGAYQFIEYGTRVRSLEAWSQDGKLLEVAKVKTGTWKIFDAEKLSKIIYRVEEMRRRDLLWPETTELNITRGYANGTNIFGYIEGFTNLRCQVSYRLPEGWKVASAVEDSSGSLTALAPNYDDLVDSPVIMGHFKRYDFTVLDKPHSIILDIDSVTSHEKSSPKNLTASFRPDSLIAVTKDIVLSHHRFFGELPYKKYLFMHRLVPLHILANYGALEHFQSSAYYMPLFDWQKARTNDICSTVSHEFFHVWNPKRFHSDRLGPFDYQNKVATRNIWFVEGVTDYYSDLILVKAGALPKEAFFQSILERVTLHRIGEQSAKEGLEALSQRIASIESINDILPFYTKGTLVMMMLDIELRERTGNRFGMDNLVLSFNERYGKTGKSFPDDSLVTIISRMSGIDITECYTKFIIGTEPLPLNDYFSKAGLVMRRVSASKPDIGYIVLPDSTGQFSIEYVGKGSAAEKIGLKEGDVVVGINDVTSESSAAFLQNLVEPELLNGSDTVTFSVLRKGKTLSLSGKVPIKKRSINQILFDPNATEPQKAIRSSIFSMPKIDRG
ncbi:MAG: PDZ domain-containing protein, partial [Chlorobiales bacterium]|nr:PDZ domain-containing protein [Chlorobiales bacterium]